MRLKTSASEYWLEMGNDSAVLVRPLPMSKSMEILEANTRFELVRGVGQVEKRDFASINRESYLYKIRGWRGMVDESGNEVSFSRANLLDVIENDQQFLTDVDIRMEERAKEKKAYEEELEKN